MKAVYTLKLNGRTLVESASPEYVPFGAKAAPAATMDSVKAYMQKCCEAAELKKTPVLFQGTILERTEEEGEGVEVVMVP